MLQCALDPETLVSSLNIQKQKQKKQKKQKKTKKKNWSTGGKLKYYKSEKNIRNYVDKCQYHTNN